MKKSVVLTFLAIACLGLKAQISNLGINYQAQVRNNAGVLIPDSSFTLRFQLLPTQFSSIPVWQEEQNVTTDRYGIASVVIGKGQKTGGTVATFDLVDFGAGNIWIKVEIKSGTNFIPLGSAEPFQSVPYAKAAGNTTLFPPGFIMAFAGDVNKIPQGWLLCDGKEVSRADYAGLYSIIGDIWGRGNNSTTFNLPDLRGLFLRGVDGLAGRDPDKASRTAMNIGGNIGNNVGSFQVDQFKSHTHTWSVWGGNVSGGGNTWGSQSATNTSNPSTSATGGNETRPKNANVNFLIKI